MTMPPPVPVQSAAGEVLGSARPPAAVSSTATVAVAVLDSPLTASSEPPDRPSRPQQQQRCCHHHHHRLDPDRRRAGAVLRGWDVAAGRGGVNALGLGCLGQCGSQCPACVVC